MKTHKQSVLKPILKRIPKSCPHAKSGFWPLFGISLGFSLLMTGLAVLVQRQRRKAADSR